MARLRFSSANLNNLFRFILNDGHHFAICKNDVDVDSERIKPLLHTLTG